MKIAQQVQRVGCIVYKTIFEWQDLNDVVNRPIKLLQHVKNIFSVYQDGQQQDAHEFIIELLNCMTSKYQIKESFGGVFKYTTICKSCGHTYSVCESAD